MNKISVAIPTYFSSSFISPTIQLLKNYSNVDEIVINDDSQNEEEYKKLDYTINLILENKNINLKISKNKKNLGAFKNKFVCIENASSDYVYQIDSDNIPSKNTLNYLLNLNLKSFDKSVLHIPSKIYLFKKYKYEYLLKPNNLVLFSLKTKVLDLEKMNSILENNKRFVISRNINWLLNTGNPFFYRSTYLSSLEKALLSDREIYAGDAIAMVYYVLENGHKISVSKFLSHFHKISDKSNFVTHGDTAMTTVSIFKDKLKKNLN